MLPLSGLKHKNPNRQLMKGRQPLAVSGLQNMQRWSKSCTVAFSVAVCALVVPFFVGLDFMIWVCYSENPGIEAVAKVWAYIFCYSACFTLTSMASFWVMRSESRLGLVLLFLNVSMASLFWIWNALI